MAGTWFRGCDGARIDDATFRQRERREHRLSRSGRGPPLVLVMGYRLNSGAWPAAFIEALAHRFSVITLDNRGTGQSDKPVDGYAIANMAQDVAGLLDKLKLAQAYVLGYSMGGAIAPELARQFPDRVWALALCA